MVFGIVITAVPIVVLGIVLLALTVFQMLVGMRKIRFKGRTHQKVHRWAAWALLALGLVHGFMGIVYALGLTVG